MVKTSNRTTSEGDFVRIEGSEMSQNLYDASVRADGALSGKKEDNGSYAVLKDTYEILNPGLEEEDYNIGEDFPTDGAKHRAAVKAVESGLEGLYGEDGDVTAYVLSSTDGKIREVKGEEPGEIEVSTYDFEDDLAEGILGHLDDIRKGNVEYKNAEEGREEYQRKLAMERNAAENDRDLAEVEAFLEQSGAPEEKLEDIKESRKRAEENVYQARQSRNSFQDLPYSNDESEDGPGLLYIEMNEPENINNFAEVMKSDALSASDNGYSDIQQSATIATDGGT